MAPANAKSRCACPRSICQTLPFDARIIYFVTLSQLSTVNCHSVVSAGIVLSSANLRSVRRAGMNRLPHLPQRRIPLPATQQENETIPNSLLVFSGTSILATRTNSTYIHIYTYTLKNIYIYIHTIHMCCTTCVSHHER